MSVVIGGLVGFALGFLAKILYDDFFDTPTTDTSTGDPSIPGKLDQIMATLEELLAGQAELSSKVDAAVGALQNVRVQIDAALALDAEADAAEREQILQNIRVDTAKLEAALTPEVPVVVEDLPPAPPEAEQLPPAEEVATGEGGSTSA